MSIRRLPDEAVDKIHSSATITCLNDVILGLIWNALDARASRITIQLDYARGNATVEDDGDGIELIEFQETGKLLKSHRR